ncbi:hypothetical protein ACWEVD_08175 [Nocardia thailandica]|uniref:Uncharacterized protein n=1 Tax=Nocardia thailandica TaxID=257275 RepID=A0ABW6PS99_9NOCA|nr:hypothetical protein [Nocardia thailandica]
MHNRTVRAGLAGIAAAAALTATAGAASAQGLQLEPYSGEPAVAGYQIGEEWTSTGTSSISSGVNAKVTCILQNTLSALGANC